MQANFPLQTLPPLAALLQKSPAADILAPMVKSRKDKDKQGPVSVNKKAYRDFELTDKLEAGMQLLGSEVKSLSGRAGRFERFVRQARGQPVLAGWCNNSPV